MTTSNKSPSLRVPAGAIIPPGVPGGMAGPRHVVRPRPASAASEYLRIAPLLILALALLMPAEVRVALAGQTLYAYRIAWIALLPFVFFQFSRGAMQFRANDLFVTIGAGWITVSFVANYGAVIGIPSGIGASLDLIAPYFIARASIRNMNDFRRLMIILSPVVFVFAVLMPVEGVTQSRFIRDAAAAAFGSLGTSEYGQTSAFRIATDTRMGLLRAMGPFSHPILAGVFFSTLLPIYYFSKTRGIPRFLGFSAGFAAFFSLSSAAILGVVLFIALAIYDYLRRVVSFLSWPLFLGSVAALFAVLHVVSKNGILSVLIRFTMDPATGLYRLLIWEYGGKSVVRHPLFGIGYQKFEALAWMGDSIDTLWLHLAVRSGLPSALFLLLATLWAVAGTALTAGRRSDPDHSTLIGLSIALAILAIAAFSVSFFGGMLTWYAMLLGIGSTLGTVKAEPQPQRRAIIRRI